MTTRAPALVCYQCRGEEFVAGADGHLACVVCGVQSQDFVEEKHDEEYGARRTLEKNVSRKKEKRALRIKQDEEEEHVPAEDVARAYCKALQSMIQMVCEVLVDNFNVDVRLLGVTGQLWLSLVQQSEVLTPQFSEQALQEALAAQQPADRWDKLFAPTLALRLDDIADSTRDEGGEASDIETEDEDNNIQLAQNDRTPSQPASIADFSSLRRTRRQSILRIALNRRLPLSLMLALPKLACDFLREPYISTNFVRWALTGQLPFFTAHVSTEPDELLQLVSLVPTFAPSPRELDALSNRLAHRLQLTLPPVPHRLVAARFLQELQLSSALGAYMERLFDMHTPAALLPGNQDSRAATSSQLAIMAHVVLVWRFVYGLGSGKAAPPCPSASWADWAKGVLETQPDLVGLLAPREYRDLLDERLHNYLEFCKNSMFVGSAVPAELATLQQSMQELGRPQQAGPRNSNRVAHTLSKALDSALAQRRYTSTAIALRQQIRTQSGNSEAESENYVAVIVACACHVWVTPFVLHLEVQRLENLLTKLEEELQAAAAGPTPSLTARKKLGAFQKCAKRPATIKRARAHLPSALRPSEVTHMKRRKKAVFPKEAVDAMRSWLDANSNKPLLVKADVDALTEQTGLSFSQVRRWCDTERRKRRRRTLVDSAVC